MYILICKFYLTTDVSLGILLVVSAGILATVSAFCMFGLPGSTGSPPVMVESMAAESLLIGGGADMSFTEVDSGVSQPIVAIDKNAMKRMLFINKTFG